jgi:hypothetical protein
MGNLLSDLLAYPHPMLNHFVIALLIVSVVLDLWGRWNPAMRYTAWVTLVLGTLATIPTVITGILAHVPYEGTAVIESIEVHEQLGLATAALFMVLTFVALAEPAERGHCAGACALSGSRIRCIGRAHCGRPDRWSTGVSTRSWRPTDREVKGASTVPAG